MIRPQHRAALAKGLDQEHDVIRSQFDRFRHADKGLRATQKALDRLMRLGNGVTQDEVLDMAGKHVASGFMSAPQMAQFLGAMPSQDGPQLAAWIGQQDQKVRAMAQQFGAKLEMARHAYANSAMRVLQASHGLAQPQGAQPPADLAPPQPTGGLAATPPAGEA